MSKILLPFLIACSLLICGCQQKDIGVESRSFFMGFTPFPYAYNALAIGQTDDFVAEHGDIVSFHLDTGVPWYEALSNEPFPSNVLDKIDEMKALSNSFENIFLSLTPLSIDRSHLAGHWNTTGESQPLDDYWAEKSFDDEEIAKAFLNYCRTMIDSLKPDYFAYAIEANVGFLDQDTLFTPFTALCDTVYHTLKTEYPDLPVMLTLVTNGFFETYNELLPYTEALVEYTDFIAISTYPYMPGYSSTLNANPNNLERDWFSRMRDLAPEKPFAISETGYIAQDLDIPQYFFDVNGHEIWQRDYVLWMLDEMNRLDGKFVIWFVSRDYDQGADFLGSLGAPVSFNFWKDTGMLDGEGYPRLGLTAWESWRSLSHVD